MTAPTSITGNLQSIVALGVSVGQQDSLTLRWNAQQAYKRRLSELTSIEVEVVRTLVARAPVADLSTFVSSNPRAND